MSEKKDKSRKGNSSVGRKSKYGDEPIDALSRLINEDPDFQTDLQEVNAGQFQG